MADDEVLDDVKAILETEAAKLDADAKGFENAIRFFSKRFAVPEQWVVDAIPLYTGLVKRQASLRHLPPEVLNAIISDSSVYEWMALCIGYVACQYGGWNNG